MKNMENLKNRLQVLTAAGIFLLVAGIGPRAFAAMTFAPTSPQSDLTLIVVPTCDTGDHFSVFEPMGVEFGVSPCDGLNGFSPYASEYGDYTVIECTLSLSTINNCDFPDVATALSDPGFVSEQIYTWAAPVVPTTPDATSTPEQVQTNIFNGFLLFLLTAGGFISYFAFKFKR